MGSHHDYGVDCETFYGGTPDDHPMGFVVVDREGTQFAREDEGAGPWEAFPTRAAAEAWANQNVPAGFAWRVCDLFRRLDR
jgi:hypothetical protein